MALNYSPARRFQMKIGAKVGEKNARMCGGAAALLPPTQWLSLSDFYHLAFFASQSNNSLVICSEVTFTA